MHRKQIIERVFGFNNDTAVLTFLVRFLSTRLLVFFCWAFSRLHSVGRVFGKALRILGLDVRNGMWAVEQDFHRDFRVNVKWFFAFFSGLLD